MFAQETAEITRLEISQNKNHELVKTFSIGAFSMWMFCPWCFSLSSLIGSNSAQDDLDWHFVLNIVFSAWHAYTRLQFFNQCLHFVHNS